LRPDDHLAHLPVDSACARWMQDHRQPIVRGDVPWDPAMNDPELQQAVLAELNDLGAEVLLPIIYKSQLRGVVALGGKSSEESYTIEDLRLLTTVATEAAVAIENSRLVEALREEDQRRARFINDIAHELKTPVTSIKMFAEILLDGVEDETKRQHFLRVLVEESNRYVRLVDDLLYVARHNAQPPRFRREAVALQPLLRETLEVFQLQAEEKNISLRLEPAEENGDLWIPGDRDRLKQVMVNLVNNAIKYTGNGGEIVVELAREGDYAVTRVRDTGIGIAPDDLNRVFDMFYRGSRAQSLVGAGGAGVGLAIVKDIVERHGGELLVESTPGKGSTFTVRLPTT